MIKKILSAFYFFLLRPPKRLGWEPMDDEEIIEQLSSLGIPVKNFIINIDQYKDYFDKAEYSSRYPKQYQGNIREKTLEHFIAQELLQINPIDVYIDIASAGSSAPEIYQRLYGCTTYAQDLDYKPGIHGNKIGSDAASLPLPDESVTKMALHCSFEHFEGDSDSGFIKESARVLQVGGKVVIVPLYLASRYAIGTDLLVSRYNQVKFEKDALVMAIDGFKNRHGRLYDASHLSSRVFGITNKLSFSIFRIMNGKEVDESIYVRFALVGTRIEY